MVTNVVQSVTTNRIVGVSILDANRGLVQVWAESDSEHEHRYIASRGRGEWTISNPDEVDKSHDPEWVRRRQENALRELRRKLEGTQQELASGMPLTNYYRDKEDSLHRVGRGTLCAPPSPRRFPNGAHGVTRPTT